MFYKPISDGVVCKKAPIEGTSKGGILLPPGFEKHIGRGVIVAVGPGRITDCGREEMDVHVGDIVLYNASRVVPVDDSFILTQSDIFAICVDDGKEVEPPPAIKVAVAMPQNGALN